MSFHALTDDAYSKENYNYTPLPREDDRDTETSSLLSKVDGEIKTTTSAKIVTWIKDHKKQILIALLIIGITALSVGAGLIIGACTSSLTAGYIAYAPMMRIITYYTTAGAVALAGIIFASLGGSLTSFATAALLCKNQ